MRASVAVTATIRQDNTNREISLPVIVTRDGVLTSYLEYLLLYRTRSNSWTDRSVRAIRLLLDYVEVHSREFESPQKMFACFSEALFTGTIGRDHKDGTDLYWRPRDTRDANGLIGLITHYSDWLAVRNEDQNLQLNPWREATSYEQRLNWAAYCHKKDRAFLSHLWKLSDAKKSTAKSRVVRNRKQLGNDKNFESARAFPVKKTAELFSRGFVIPSKDHETEVHKKLNLRDILITILMQYGGLRISEVFHLYVEDIAPIGNREFIVKVYHPSDGDSPDPKYKNRREYLAQKYGLQPRHEYPTSKKIFAGWKNPRITHTNGNFFTVYFFPSEASALFYNYWRLYLQYQRVKPSPYEPHPFAFTNRNGKPFSIRAYEVSRERAVKRIGLQYNWESCTTPHADRHAYGLSLSEAGVQPMIIREAMHHHSLESQNVYTAPTDKFIRKTLMDIESRMALTPFNNSLTIK